MGLPKQPYTLWKILDNFRWLNFLDARFLLGLYCVLLRLRYQIVFQCTFCYLVFNSSFSKFNNNVTKWFNKTSSFILKLKILNISKFLAEISNPIYHPIWPLNVKIKPHYVSSLRIFTQLLILMVLRKLKIKPVQNSTKITFYSLYQMM